MNILNITTALILGAAAALPAQSRTAMDFFRMGGADVAIPLVDSLSRMDMADYFDSGIARASKNRAQGEAIIVSASPETVVFKQAGDIESVLYVVTAPGADTLLMVTETLSLPQEDTRVAFYNKNWNPVARQPLETPGLEDWLTADGLKNVDAVADALPFMLVTWKYAPDTRVLTLTHNMGQYFSKSPDQLAILEKYVRPQLSYTFDGKKFKRN